MTTFDPQGLYVYMYVCMNACMYFYSLQAQNSLYFFCFVFKARSHITQAELELIKTRMTLLGLLAYVGLAFC